MKILRVFATFQTEILYAEHHLSRELHKQGHCAIFLSSAKKPAIWENYVEAKFEIVRRSYEHFDLVRLPAWFPFEKAFHKQWRQPQALLEKENPDVYHLYGLGFFSSFIILYVLKRSISEHIKKVLISDHTDNHSHKRDGFEA